MSTGVSSVLNVYDEIKNSQHKATISDSKIWHQRAGMESKPFFSGSVAHEHLWLMPE